MRVRTSLLGAVLLALTGCAAATTDEVTLCDLLTNRQNFDGKTVTVEASLLLSRHGSAILDRSCGGGLPVTWDDSALHLEDLGANAQQLIGKPVPLPVRVTGTLRRTTRTASLSGDEWHFDLRDVQMFSD